MFGKRIKLFTLLGFTVHMDLSWLIIMALVTWSLAEGVFRQIPDPTQPADRTPEEMEAWLRWTMGLAGAFGLFVSIVFHEMMHSVVARRYGLPMKGITLFVFGGVAEMSDEPPSPKAEFLMALAGPAASLVLALLLAAVGLSVVALEAPRPVSMVLLYLAALNILLLIFNLIPAFPLDGGRALRAALWHFKGNVRWATRVTSKIGGGFGILLVVLGVVNFFIGNFIGGLWLFLIGLFIRNAAQSSFQQLLMRQALSGERVSRFMSVEVVSVPPQATVRQLIEDYIYRYHFKLYPVSEDGRLQGCISTRDVSHIPREQWDELRVGQIISQCKAGNTTSPDADAMEALTKMAQGKTSRLLVVEGERLAGIITMKDMMRFLSLKLELEGDDSSPAANIAGRYISPDQPPAAENDE